MGRLAECGVGVVETALHDRCLKRNVKLNRAYKIKRAISSSELSNVYIARHMETGETRIVKEFFPRALAMRDLDYKSVLCRMPNERHKFEQLRETFLNEVIMLSQLEHERIVAFIEKFEENGTVYLVTEYCRGTTLDAYIQELLPIQSPNGLPHFFKQTIVPLIAALEYIHKQGIIHRDLKPKNIIIDKVGLPKLIDFGSATHVQQQDGREEMHHIFTTKGFSPLELYSTKSKQGVHSDIYSLAAILYYVLSGSAPTDVTARLFEDNLEHINRNNKKITPLLSHVIMWGLALKHQKRCSSLEWFKLAVQAEHLMYKVKQMLPQTRLFEK
ncbi:serine/threonine protein kinase [Paenibacillus sp. 481]|uniref:serine/threonine protein kinase n=1 Tax=Paenibacillus sp. 481 TaxID=2835869 RepID=UPI001E5677DB|nr:serine/threonine-protein kinase [Paenibacillus sp. 481]UHA72247.1 serine/threonine protein kinase [Paenibacillus sp. 481]